MPKGLMKRENGFGNPPEIPKGLKPVTGICKKMGGKFSDERKSIKRKTKKIEKKWRKKKNKKFADFFKRHPFFSASERFIPGSGAKSPAHKARVSLEPTRRQFSDEYPDRQNDNHTKPLEENAAALPETDSSLKSGGHP